MSPSVFLRGGTVLTLGAKTANLAEGDVVLVDDRIAEVGQNLRPPRDAETIDCADTIVMPGFVDTHRHTWTSLFRNAGDDPDAGGSSAPFRDRYGPDDVYAATLVGLLGAVEAGITTVVDWLDLATDDRLVDAAVRAHADAGVRTVLVVPGDPGAGAERARAASDAASNAGGPSLEVATGIRITEPADLDAVARGIEEARAAGLRIHLHADAGAAPAGTVAGLAGRGLLRDDVTLVHHSALGEADVRAIAETGCAVSLAPSSEMAGGHGSPPIQELMDRDIRPGLGVDHERVAPGDLFAQMRQTISLQHATVFDRKLMGKGSLPKLMSTRDVIRSATVDGARAAGLAGVTGALEPSLRADVIVLRTDRPNIWPINDAIGAVVWGMDTSNLDHVFVGGRALLRRGELVVDARAVRDRAVEARARLVGAAGAGSPGASR